MTSGASTFWSGVKQAAAEIESAVNETPIRLAVTGLSRAGKTVFITSLVCNFLALGNGYVTLKKIHDLLSNQAQNRLKRIGIAPLDAGIVSAFDYKEKLSELASETPSWPPRTVDVARIALEIEVARNSAFWNKLGHRRIRLEILDYPGEWLLDLPLLTRSFADWSRETLATLRRPPRQAVFVDFLDFLSAVDPNEPSTDELVLRGHTLYRAALLQCRDRLGLRYLQPGRFLCPGPRSDAPFMCFFPVDLTGSQPGRGTVGALLGDRYEAYKTDMRTTFFDTHFKDFDRQMVLVDLLGALSGGKAAFEDTSRAIAEIAAGMRYGWNLPRPIQHVAAAAMWVGKLQAQGLYGSRVAEAMSQALLSRRVEKVAFIATKADHVPAMRRDNLRNLLRALAEPARAEQGGMPVTYHAVAAVLSTEDGTTRTTDGRPMEVVFGVPHGEGRARPFYAGDVPSAHPPESFWSDRYFELPVFKPPRIDKTGSTGIPHLGVDEALSALLEDRL